MHLSFQLILANAMQVLKYIKKKPKWPQNMIKKYLIWNTSS